MKTTTMMKIGMLGLLAFFVACSGGSRRNDIRHAADRSSNDRTTITKQQLGDISHGKSSGIYDRSADYSTSGNEIYRLGFGDVLDIRFFNNRQYNLTVPVRPDGRITIEQIGDLDVSGKTPAYVDSVITSKFSNFLRNPEVTVIVTEFGNNHVYVLGEVDAPGRFVIAQNMTVMQAIASAGGATKDAKMSSVLLIRPDENLQPVITRLNLDDLQKKSGVQALTSMLRPNDIIYVPDTFLSDVSESMTQIYHSILPPVDSYFRALFWSRL